MLFSFSTLPMAPILQWLISPDMMVRATSLSSSPTLLPLAHSAQATLIFSTSPDTLQPPLHLLFWNVLPFMCQVALFLTFGFLFKCLFKNLKFLSCTYYPSFLLHFLCSSYYYTIDCEFYYVFIICLT